MVLPAKRSTLFLAQTSNRPPLFTSIVNCSVSRSVQRDLYLPRTHPTEFTLDDKDPLWTQRFTIAAANGSVVSLSFLFWPFELC